MENMADYDIMSVLEDDFFDNLVQEVNAFVEDPLPTPPPRERSIRQHQLLPRPAHSRGPAFPLNNSPQAPSLGNRVGARRVGRGIILFSHTLSRRFDPPSSTSRPSRLSPPPTLDASRGLPPLTTTQNGPHSSSGNSLSRRAATPQQRAPDSDDFLEALADGVFSSPSIPPQSSPHFSPRRSGGPTTGSLSRHGDGAAAMPVTREQKRRSSDVIEITNLESSDLTPKRRRAAEDTLRTSQQDEQRQAKRPRANSTKIECALDDKVFGDVDEEDIINLAETEEYPRAESEPEVVDDSVRLGGFQCVICMDDVTDLTVTHCGHLFCSECLHSSLNMDPSKKICPICRQKLDTRPSSGKFSSKSKGFWPLELKLMTAKRSGKLPAR